MMTPETYEELLASLNSRASTFDRRMGFSANVELLEAVDRECERLDTTKSQLLRTALLRYFASQLEDFGFQPITDGAPEVGDE